MISPPAVPSYGALSGPMRFALENLVMNQSSAEEIVLPQFLEDIIARRGRREMILKAVARSSIALTDAERARITSCNDLATLDRWVENAFTARTLAELLA